MKNLKNSIAALIVLVTCNVFAQTPEVVFDTYAHATAQKSSRYLLADDVALRDCPTTFCEKLTTLRIGTKVRLLEKSDNVDVINGITSSWYKVKMGPDTGWIFGGLISQATITSKANPEVKFVFGEESVRGIQTPGAERRYQIRAIKNGVEQDKIVFTSHQLFPEDIKNLGNEYLEKVDDILCLNGQNGESCEVNNGTLFIVWKDHKLYKETNLITATDYIAEEGYCSIESPQFDN